MAPLDQAQTPLIDPKPERSDSAENVDPSRMPLGDHLEELRRRSIYALIAVAVCAVVCLLFGKRIVSLLLTPLGQVLAAFDMPAQAYAFGVPTGFAVYLKVSILAGVVAAFPVIAWQGWRFVASGLYAHERRFVLVVAPFCTLMSALAMGFLYFVLLPICLVFLIFFNSTFPPIGPDHAAAPPSPVLGTMIRAITGEAPSTTDDALAAPAPGGDLATLPLLVEDPADAPPGAAWIKLPERELRVQLGPDQTYRFLPLRGGSAIQTMLDIDQYVRFVTLLGLGVLLAFQTPVVMLMAGWSGLVKAKQARKVRRYAMFGAFALGALLTPADPISMLVLAGPLYGLFELGIVAMRLAERRAPVTDPTNEGDANDDPGQDA
ncbi:MAG: twin-arginine translocase subunit TatC [Planctomycetota bacterium]